MLKIYVIGSDRFKGSKNILIEQLNKSGGAVVLAVGFSPVFDYPFKKKDVETLHALENRAIEEADIVILVDGDKSRGEHHIGKDTNRELEYCRALGKTVLKTFWDNRLTLMGESITH